LVKGGKGKGRGRDIGVEPPVDKPTDFGAWGEASEDRPSEARIKEEQQRLHSPVDKIENYYEHLNIEPGQRNELEGLRTLALTLGEDSPEYTEWQDKLNEYTKQGKQNTSKGLRFAGKVLKALPIIGGAFGAGAVIGTWSEESEAAQTRGEELPWHHNLMRTLQVGEEIFSPSPITSFDIQEGLEKEHSVEGQVEAKQRQIMGAMPRMAPADVTDPESYKSMRKGAEQLVKESEMVSPYSFIERKEEPESLISKYGGYGIPTGFAGMR
jgi:hypothetical protein